MKTIKSLVMAANALILFVLLIQPVSSMADGTTELEDGKRIAFSRRLGNCLACHQISGGTLAGNIGPPLVSMKLRYPDEAKLRAQIFDSTVRNPYSSMPPFGKHKILSEKEIDLVTHFIHSL